MKYMPQNLIVCALIVFATGAIAQPSFTEDFSTDTYFQEASNSAHWDTTTGMVHHYPFETSFSSVTDTPGNVARKLAVQGHYAFVADGYSGVQVLDIRNPLNPELVSSIDTPGYVYQIHPHGNEAYVADHSGGLRVLDISDPLAPTEIASFTLPGLALGVWVNGDICYVGCGGAGLAVLSIIDPSNPAQYAQITTPGNGARSIQTHGNLAFVTDGDSGLAVLDMTDPYTPTLAASMTGFGTARDLVIQGDYLYMSENNHGLSVVDISDPLQPVIVGTGVALGETRSLDVFGDRLYLANDNHGVRIYDVSYPPQPILREIIDTPGHAYDALQVGEHLLVADQVPGVQSYRVAFRNEPSVVGEVPVGNQCLPTASEDLLFHAENDQLIAVDMSDLDSPVTLGSITVGEGLIKAMATSGDLVMVITGNGNCFIVDATDPANMSLLGDVGIDGDVRSVVCDGTHAYLSSDYGLQVINYTDPMDPSMDGPIEETIVSSSFEVQGNLGVAYGNSYNLELIDVTLPDHPNYMSNINLGGTGGDVVIHGNYLYVAVLYEGLMVYDISDPHNPVQTVSRALPNTYGALEVVGNYLYMSTNNGIESFRLNNPGNPSLHIQLFEDELGGYGLRSLEAMGGQLYGYDHLNSELKVLQTMQHQFDLYRKYATSNFISTGTDTIVRIRYNAMEQGLVLWSLMVNYSDAGYGVNQNQWHKPSYPGPGMTFTAELGYQHEVVTSIDQLKLEWLYEFPIIDTISDVPNDQGRRVRLEWVRSGHDFADAENQVTEYAIYRQVDPDLGFKRGADHELSQASASLQENVEVMLTSGWDYVSSVPVLLEDRYSVLVETLADSTLADGDYDSVFKVVGLTATPGQFFASYPDSGSSADNLAPNIPTGVTAQYGPGGVTLNWEESLDYDFRFFNIYRGDQPGFVPDQGNLVHQAEAPGWVDTDMGPGAQIYQITAVDFAGNESGPAETQFASDAPLGGSRFAIHGAVPNPFNPSTRIDFSMAQSGPVRLNIYDVSGRLIRTLVDENLSEGDHSRRWDGRDQSGQTVASGAYIALLKSGDQVQRHRMMLMK